MLVYICACFLTIFLISRFETEISRLFQNLGISRFWSFRGWKVCNDMDFPRIHRFARYISQYGNIQLLWKIKIHSISYKGSYKFHTIDFHYFLLPPLLSSHSPSFTLTFSYLSFSPFFLSFSFLSSVRHPCLPIYFFSFFLLILNLFHSLCLRPLSYPYLPISFTIHPSQHFFVFSSVICPSLSLPFTLYLPRPLISFSSLWFPFLPTFHIPP